MFCAAHGVVVKKETNKIFVDGAPSPHLERVLTQLSVEHVFGQSLFKKYFVRQYIDQLNSGLVLSRCYLVIRMYYSGLLLKLQTLKVF